VLSSVGFSDGQSFRRAFELRFGAKPPSYLKINAAETFFNGTVIPSSMEKELLARAAERLAKSLYADE
jgi:hypothetical protein